MSEQVPIAVPEGLRGLAAHDPEVLALLRAHRESLEERSPLDVRTTEMVRLGTLIGMGAAPDAIRSHVLRLRTDGATVDDVWGIVLAVLPVTGVARVVQAGAAIESALNEDVE